jgi:hypothetical protein
MQQETLCYPYAQSLLVMEQEASEISYITTWKYINIKEFISHQLSRDHYIAFLYHTMCFNTVFKAWLCVAKVLYDCTYATEVGHEMVCGHVITYVMRSRQLS